MPRPRQRAESLPQRVYLQRAEALNAAAYSRMREAKRAFSLGFPREGWLSLLAAMGELHTAMTLSEEGAARYGDPPALLDAHEDAVVLHTQIQGALLIALAGARPDLSWVEAPTSPLANLNPFR